MPVTINDVAAAAGVSIKTVSRVLNHEPNVRTKTRDRVMTAVNALHYRPNPSARSLATARSLLIALFIDNPSTAYVTEFQLGAIARCREAGFHLTVEPIESGSEKLEEVVRPMITNLRVDGVILTPPVSDDAVVMQVLKQTGTPFVRIAPESEPQRAPEVHMDDARAAYEMTRHLIELGHSDIAFIMGHPQHGAARLRHEGFRQAMADAGLEVRPDRVKQGYFSFKSGFECAEALLADDARPSAIFASNDDMALGVLAMAHRRGLNVPDDLSIAGFDDTPAASVVWPQISTVRQPIFDMGAAAADLIITGAARRALNGAPATSQLLDFRVLPRESTAPPARAANPS